LFVSLIPEEEGGGAVLILILILLLGLIHLGAPPTDRQTEPRGSFLLLFFTSKALRPPLCMFPLEVN